MIPFGKIDKETNPFIRRLLQSISSGMSTAFKIYLCHICLSYFEMASKNLGLKLGCYIRAGEE